MYSTFDSVGNRTSVQAGTQNNPGWYQRTYQFDNLNRISNVLDGAATLNTFEYVGAGTRLGKQTNDFNGTQVDVGTNGWDLHRRLTAITHRDSSNNAIYGLTYTYDKNDNELQELKSAPSNWVNKSRMSPFGRTWIWLLMVWALTPGS